MMTNFIMVPRGYSRHGRDCFGQSAGARGTANKYSKNRHIGGEKETLKLKKTHRIDQDYIRGGRILLDEEA